MVTEKYLWQIRLLKKIQRMLNNIENHIDIFENTVTIMWELDDA